MNVALNVTLTPKIYLVQKFFNLHVWHNHHGFFLFLDHNITILAVDIIFMQLNEMTISAYNGEPEKSSPLNIEGSRNIVGEIQIKIYICS